MKIAYVYIPPVPTHKRCSYLGICEHEGIITITTYYVFGKTNTEKACVHHAGTMVNNRIRHEQVDKVISTRALGGHA